MKFLNIHCLIKLRISLAIKIRHLKTLTSFKATLNLRKRRTRYRLPSYKNEMTKKGSKSIKFPSIPNQPKMLPISLWVLLWIRSKTKWISKKIRRFLLNKTSRNQLSTKFKIYQRCLCNLDSGSRSHTMNQPNVQSRKTEWFSHTLLILTKG